MPTTEDRPNDEVKIADCGVIESGADYGVCASDGTEDVYPHHPGDLDLDWYLMSNFEKLLEIFNNIKASGNHFYKSGDNKAAVKKYRKALKYISHLRDSMGSTEDAEEEKIRAVEVPVCLNMAAALLRSPKTPAVLDEAKKQCENVLEIDTDNAKALFRRGQVHFWRQVSRFPFFGPNFRFSILSGPRSRFSRSEADSLVFGVKIFHSVKLQNKLF